MNLFSKFKFHNTLFVLLVLCIFLVYGCPDSTEVSPGAGGCFTATMKYTLPEGTPMGSETCTTTFASFVFVRTDVPDFEPIVLPPFGGGAAVLQDGLPTCRKTRKLWSADIHDNGFGTWQVTMRFAPNWEVTCPEVEISECPTLNSDVEIPIAHATVGLPDCIQEKKIAGDGTIVPFP